MCADFKPKAVLCSVTGAKLNVEKLPLRTCYVRQDLYGLGKTAGKINSTEL